MRAAVVDQATNVVINIIVADAATDAAPDFCILVDVARMSCDINWVYDPAANAFTNPNPPPPAPEPLPEEPVA